MRSVLRMLAISLPLVSPALADPPESQDLEESESHQARAQASKDDHSELASGSLESLLRRKAYLEARIDTLRDEWASRAAELQGYLAVASQHVNFANSRTLPIAMMGSLDAQRINGGLAMVKLDGRLRRQIERHFATAATALRTLQARGKAAEQELADIAKRLPELPEELQRRLEALDSRLDSLADQWSSSCATFEGAYTEASQFINFNLPRRLPVSQVFASSRSGGLNTQPARVRLAETSDTFRRLVFELGSEMTRLRWIEAHGQRTHAERAAIQKRLTELESLYHRPE